MSIYIDKLNSECKAKGISVVKFIKHWYDDENNLYDIRCYNSNNVLMQDVYLNNDTGLHYISDEEGAYEYFPKDQKITKLSDNVYTVQYYEEYNDQNNEDEEDNYSEEIDCYFND